MDFWVWGVYNTIQEKGFLMLICRIKLWLLKQSTAVGSKKKIQGVPKNTTKYRVSIKYRVYHEKNPIQGVREKTKAYAGLPKEYDCVENLQ